METAVFRGVALGGTAEDAGTDAGNSNNQDLQTVDRIRTDFPETWLWLDDVTGYDNFKVTTNMLGYYCEMVLD